VQDSIKLSIIQESKVAFGLSISTRIDRCALFHTKWQLLEPTLSNLLQLGPYCQRRKSSRRSENMQTSFEKHVCM